MARCRCCLARNCTRMTKNREDRRCPDGVKKQPSHAAVRGRRYKTSAGFEKYTVILAPILFCMEVQDQRMSRVHPRFMGTSAREAGKTSKGSARSAHRNHQIRYEEPHSSPWPRWPDPGIHSVDGLALGLVGGRPNRHVDWRKHLWLMVERKQLEPASGPLELGRLRLHGHCARRGQPEL